MRQRVSDLGRGQAQRQSPAAPARRQGGRYSVLFVCIGNAIRSQMAEAFARKYGADVISPSSAGLSPAPGVAALTVKVMAERGLNLEAHYAKSLGEAPGSPWDMIVNISGERLPPSQTPVRSWTVADPVGQPEEAFQAAAEQIEALVMQLVLDLRSRR
jgi:protein-tyrosine-phosphatase